MAAPIYFLPQLHLQDLRDGARFRASIVEQRRLTHVLGDVVDLQAECAITDLRGAGPGGQSGLLVTRLGDGGRGLPERFGFYPDFQEWHDAGEFWIGLDREQRPEPEDLLRRRPRVGDWSVELSDGKHWVVPVVRRPDGSSELPHSVGWRRGAFVEQIRRDYAAIWERTARVVEWFTGDGPTRHDYAEAATIAVEVLAINYRLSEAEVTALDLLDTTNLWTVLMSAIDWQRVERLLDAQKKTTSPSDPETPSTSPGSEASVPTIAPAAESSS